MPCYDSDYAQAISERLDEVTQMLCWLCGQVSYSYNTTLITQNLKLAQWWNEHLKSDTKRVLNEMRVYTRMNPNQTADRTAAHFIQRTQVVHAVSDFHKEWFLDLACRVVAERSQQGTQDRRNKLEDALSKLTPEEREVLGY